MRPDPGYRVRHSRLNRIGRFAWQELALGIWPAPQFSKPWQQLNHDIPKRCISEVLNHVYHSRLQQLALSIAIVELLRLLVARCADDVSIARHVEQVIVRVVMAQRAVMWRDLDRKRAHELVLDHEMMPRLLLDGDDVLARISLLVQSYSFVGAGAGLNSITTRRISWAPVLVSPWLG